jgi:FAD:protein FMN transferase
MRALVLSVVLLGCRPTPPAAPEPPAPEPVVVDLRGEALGTTWHVRWAQPGEGPDRTAEVQRVTEAVLAEVDLHMSTWRDDSELSRARQADGPVAVSRDTALVVDAALDLARMTGGAFDPTVQPLMELWGFHGERREALPTDAEIAAVRERVGHDRVRLMDGPEGPTLDVQGTALDLSAIAKGHAVDRVHHAVSELGIGRVFVEVGGEVRASGPGVTAPAWRVGVDRPVPGAAPGQDLALVARVVNGAVATSGNYRNRYEVDGQVLVHTMDPRVGRPVTTPVASATVLAPDARTADGLATALMVLAPDEGLALVDALPHVEAALLLLDGEGLQLRTSAGAAGRIRVVGEGIRAFGPASPDPSP